MNMEQREAHRSAKAQLAMVEREIEEKTRMADGLRRVVAGFDILESIHSDPPETQIELTGISVEQSDKATPDGDSFKSGLLAIVKELGAKRAVHFDKVVEEGQARGLKTNASSFKMGVRYTMATLKQQKLVRSPKRAMYRYIGP